VHHVRTAAVGQVIVLIALLASAPRTFGQGLAPDTSRNAPIHLGPLALSPAFTIADLGRDSNVFNESHNPKSDFVATLVPSTQVWLRMGRATIAGTTRLDATLFQQYASESTVSSVSTARVDLSLNRIQPYLSASFMRFNDRPDLEIDSRVEHRLQNTTLGVLVKIAPRTFVRLSAERSGLTFAEGRSFRGRDLQELNRVQELRGGGVEYDLTPVTRVLLDVQREKTRFAFTPKRNANGLRASSGLMFKPRAFLSGYARAGFLRYEPNDPRTQRYTGLIASANVRSIILGANDLSAVVDRDLFYSVDAQVYYIQTRVATQFTRQLTGRWNVSANASRQWLAYSTNITTGFPVGEGPVDATNGNLSPAAFVSTRPETASALGMGIGYRLSRYTVTGLGVSYVRRDAALEAGRYNNLRILATVTYGPH
jgi:hypothetical protein